MKDNLLENNFLIDLLTIYTLKEAFQICHYVPPCAKGGGGLTLK